MSNHITLIVVSKKLQKIWWENIKLLRHWLDLGLSLSLLLWIQRFWELEEYESKFISYQASADALKSWYMVILRGLIWSYESLKLIWSYIEGSWYVDMYQAATDGLESWYVHIERDPGGHPCLQNCHLLTAKTGQQNVVIRHFVIYFGKFGLFLEKVFCTVVKDKASVFQCASFKSLGQRLPVDEW